jgi:TonB family protein
LPEQTEVEERLFEKAASDSSLDQSLPSSPSPPNGYSGPSSDHQGPLNDFGGSNTLAESLTRLELNSLQLKIYLDSIDQRISRMEPRLENVAPLVPSTPQLPHSDPSVSNEQGRAATAGRVASGSLAVLARLWTDSRTFYSSRQIALPILAGVAMLLLSAFLFIRFGRNTGDVVVHPVNASVEGGVNATGASLAPRAAASVSDPPVAADRGAQGNGSAHGSMGRGVGRPVDPVEKPTPSSKKSAQIPFRSSSAAAPTMAKDAAEVTDPSDGADDLSSVPLSNRLVNVSSGVMAANLVSSPKPSYPTLASLTHTQGNVVMQAVISKEGTVEEVHVIKGHRLLRGAAKNAVRNWRYRPYKIDGVPVDVATTVSVDFSLHH